MNKYILTTTLLIGGCSPLQQAPLVYTSKQVLGIDISAPTTESTGFSMNLGFKNIDAAYVPLAVSKETEGVITPIKEIYATYGEGPQAERAAATPEQQQAVAKLTKDLVVKEQQVSLLKSARTQLIEHKTLIDNKTSLGSKPLSKKLSELLILPPDIETKLESKQVLTPTQVKETVGSVTEGINKKEVEAGETKKEIAQVLSISKRDAMSVFGSFDSGLKSEGTSGVSHQLGKMFSTGVAAQNLTQGLQRYAVLEQCLNLIKSTADAAQKKDLIAMCSRSTGAANPIAEP
ncbi:hypothetical protein H8F23_09585 [Pseudomonas sp. P155]|uniref:Lipoprotein n=1 Tax=Pseudomonas neuropathica TaxID=2730425 RepID=A0ABS0BM36_9PSED|nr:hypothetical protein [Pseudomonas neuropathica]MBF6033500.1 hypothetical protein [Pseudomonas neuropathica]